MVSPADKRTVRQVVQLLETSYEVKLTNRAEQKSVKRAEAEVSKMNAVTLLNVIGATHFIVGESEDDGEELPVHNWMVSAVKKFHGGLGLRVVRQELLISIDATSMLANTSAS